MREGIVAMKRGKVGLRHFGQKDKHRIEMNWCGTWASFPIGPVSRWMVLKLGGSRQTLAGRMPASASWKLALPAEHRHQARPRWGPHLSPKGACRNLPPLLALEHALGHF